MYWNEGAMAKPGVLVFARLEALPRVLPITPIDNALVGALASVLGEERVAREHARSPRSGAELEPAPGTLSASACAAPTSEPGEVRKGSSKRTF